MTVKEYTVEQYMLDGELERYIHEPTQPKFDRTAKLARQFLKVQGREEPNNLLQFVTAVKSLEQLWEGESKCRQKTETSLSLNS